MKPIQEIINQNISSQSSAPSISQVAAARGQEAEKVSVQKEVFYSPATEAMVAARKLIAVKSFQASHERVLNERKFHEDDSLQEEQDDKLRELFLVSREMTLNSTQIGDERPLTSIRCAPQGDFAVSFVETNLIDTFDIICRLTCSCAVSSDNYDYFFYRHLVLCRVR